MEVVTSHNEEASQAKKSTFVKWALILGIAIVINLFTTYVVQVLYPAPDFNAFCPEKQVNRAIESEEACVSVGGQWNENSAKPAPGLISEPAGYCDPSFTCNKQFTEKTSLYNRNVFIVFVVVGIALLLGSVFLSGAEAVSLGLSFGGVLALVIGSLRYWSDMNDILRVILLGVALAGLLYVAWKKFHD